MKLAYKSKKIVALLLTALLLVPAFQTPSASAASGSVVSHYNYFNSVYSELNDENHVFRTATYEDIVHLFDSAGTFAVLIGGAWSTSTQEHIGIINETAKQYGVQTIYNFDTKLDGATLDIADSSNPFADYYVELVNKYLTNLQTTSEEVVSYDKAGVGAVTAPKVNEPYLFIYNKDHVDEEGGRAPIIASLEAGDLAADSYRSQVEALFDQVSEEVEGVKAAKIDTINDFDYFTTAFNTNGKATIFDSADQSIVFEHVTYDQLLGLLGSEGKYAILFGGSWCPNTQAAIKFINKYAKAYNVDKIYMWDPKLDAGVYASDPTNDPHANNRLQVRATGHPDANLYVDLVNKYLTNIVTLYDKSRNNVSYVDGDNNTVVANKLQVPYLFTYDKDHKDGEGKAAPILGHVELMYSWTNIQPNYVRNGATGVNYNNYTEGLDNLFPTLTGQSAQAAPSLPLAASAPTSASNNDGKITGAVVGLEYKLAQATVYAPVTDTTITGLGAGTYYIRYAAKDGFKASPSVKLDVPAYVPPTGGGDGGNGGNGNAGGGTPPTTGGPGTTNPSTPVSTTITAVSTSNAAEGTTSATVSTTAVNGLLENIKKAEAEGKPALASIKIDAPAQTKSADVTIPGSAFAQIGDSTQAAVQFDFANVGTIVLDAAAVKSVGAEAGASNINVRITKGELTAEGKEVLGDRPVYNLTIFAGEKEITTFGGGTVNVSIPYTLKAGEDANAIIVYYVSDEGLETIRGQYRAETGTVEFSTKHFSQYIIGLNAVNFADVAPTAWYANAVHYLAAREIANGTDETHFSPNATITRGQFIVLLLNAYGIQADSNAADNYSDAGNTYYTPYLAAAKRLGIANGTGDNQFEPNKAISRQDLFTLLHRSLTVLGELPAEKTNATIASYTDANQIAGYAAEAFKALVEGGVVSGSNNKLNPLGVTTRAEAAQVIYNLLSK
ncbi:S-layer homology domain-containing protein [Paenibacillus radicis (ex Gao et al. 2016)]|uniref:SLH domain-containing protein n=1 Tax=Paenibacillus radicis (ex Gao et al. 2016) TaxID=1737354 RepID=A0A917H1D7_9BACL|nr:S-layer homology domain-containing protein [Paenibacillus radicis (ex Gao et al. 2016)]GGG64107.1 hypothetical protein GCM10010918_17690 [Paenibacillus radicis (ex Gao et al. 2016)]